MRSKVKLRSPGYEKGRVMMTRVTVVQNIVTLLPRAEVMKRRSGVEVDIRSFLRKKNTCFNIQYKTNYYSWSERNKDSDVARLCLIILLKYQTGFS